MKSPKSKWKEFPVTMASGEQARGRWKKKWGMLIIETVIATPGDIQAVDINVSILKGKPS